jgi:hypothetical protein
MDAPIGLQLASPRWQDERLMAALRVVEKVLPLSGWQDTTACNRLGVSTSKVVLSACIFSMLVVEVRQTATLSMSERPSESGPGPGWVDVFSTMTLVFLAFFNPTPDVPFWW